MSKLPFRQIDRISLVDVLPQVFAGAETEAHVARSKVWLNTVDFSRPQHYMVEAESGAGKSSMCSFIYGNRGDYTGRILFDGTDIRGFGIEAWCDIRRRHLALLPQELNLFGELTALENIQIKNRLTGRYDTTRIMEMLDFLGVADKAGSPASRLSVGQQQRVAAVRSLCQPFNFILLDEPVSHLDSANNTRLTQLIEEIAKANSAGIISTSVGNPLGLTGDVTRIKL